MQRSLLPAAALVLFAAACSANGRGNTLAPVDASADVTFFDAGYAPADASGPSPDATIEPSTDASADAAADASDAAMALTDGQIVLVVSNANEGEIVFAQLAVRKSGTAGVRVFAQRMITDHSTANVQLVSVEEGQSIAPAPSAAAETLEAVTARTMDSLSPLSGRAFDLAYARSQVTTHAQVLTLLEGTLVPEARNAQLRALLRSAQTMVETHLALAKTLVLELGGD